MNIPGVNLLSIALGAIGSTPVAYYRAIARTVNAGGKYVTTFEAPEPVDIGSVQAIPRSAYEFMGLEQSKKYVNWYVPKEVFGLDRDGTGDQFALSNNELYQIKNVTDWSVQDGWMAALAYRVNPT